MLYTAAQRFDDAREILNEGYAAEPLFPMLPATETSVHFFRREYDKAIQCGQRALALHPYLQLGRMYFAMALEFAGRGEEALAQYRLACVMCPDLPWLRSLEAACLARAGCMDSALVILQELEHTRRVHYVDAYYMALLMDALGRSKQALQELERAFEENSTVLSILDADPKMDRLRAQHGFARLRTESLGPALAMGTH